MKLTIGGTLLLLKQGDITLVDSEAIVNAANSSLMGGGGVDGAIHCRGGSAILAACKKIRERSGFLPTGEAVITPGGRLKAVHVIHTVGPVWSGGEKGEDRLLGRCYSNCLHLAREKRIKRLAFPSISTGAYRFPVARAAEVALAKVITYLREIQPSFPEADRFQQIAFVLFSEADFRIYSEVLANDQQSSSAFGS